MLFLADAAPTGSGLAIVGAILLACLAIMALAVFLLVRLGMALWRRTHPKPTL